MSRLRYFINYVLLGFCCLSSLESYAQNNKAQSFSFTFYGERFTVSPEQMEGTPLSFDQVKPYIPVVFPDYKEDEDKPIVEILAFLRSLISGYQDLYDEGIDILARRLEKEGKWSGKNIDVLKEELKTLFRKGEMKKGVEKYAKGDVSFSYHFTQVQELFIRHLVSAYVYNMLIVSPEGKAAIDAYLIPKFDQE